MTTYQDKLITCQEAAELLGMKEQTLAIWRMTGRHSLPFVRVGRSIKYRLSDLLAWLDSRTVGRVPTREKQLA